MDIAKIRLPRDYQDGQSRPSTSKLKTPQFKEHPGVQQAVAFKQQMNRIEDRLIELCEIGRQLLKKPE